MSSFDWVAILPHELPVLYVLVAAFSSITHIQLCTLYHILVVKLVAPSNLDIVTIVVYRVKASMNS